MFSSSQSTKAACLRMRDPTSGLHMLLAGHNDNLCDGFNDACIKNFPVV